MDNVVSTALMMSWPLLLVPLTFAKHRPKPLRMLLLVIGASIGGIAAGNVIATDMHMLPIWTGLAYSSATLVLWIVFGGLARAAGGVRLFRTPLLMATLAGAVMGEIAAAAMFATHPNKKSAARMALAACGGAMMSRIGDPALLLLGAEASWIDIAPVGLLCALVSVPGPKIQIDVGRSTVTAVAMVVAVCACLLPHALIAVLCVGCVVMAGMCWFNGEDSGSRHIDAEMLLWVLGLMMLVVLSTTGGLAELIATGIEESQETFGVWAIPALTGVSVMVAAMFDGLGGAAIGVAVMDRALSIHVDHLPMAMMLGLSVGGLGPLIVSGALREGMFRWLCQVCVVVLWSWFVLS